MWLSGAALSTNLLVEEDPKNNSHLALKDRRIRSKRWRLGRVEQGHWIWHRDAQRHAHTDLQESKSPIRFVFAHNSPTWLLYWVFLASPPSVGRIWNLMLLSHGCGGILSGYLWRSEKKWHWGVGGCADCMMSNSEGSEDVTAPWQGKSFDNTERIGWECWDSLLIGWIYRFDFKVDLSGFKVLNLAAKWHTAYKRLLARCIAS